MNCPVPSCKCKFKSGSGIAHHVENGKVHKNITRQDVTITVQALDVNKTISVRQQIAAPSNVIASATTITYSATEEAFNGRSYQCFLCSKDTFKTLNALNSHLNSPAHDANEFKCPICAKEFKVVSALAQHVETYGCAKGRVVGVGATSAREVERYIDKLTAKFASQNRIQM
jgi:hypothetical protein